MQNNCNNHAKIEKWRSPFPCKKPSPNLSPYIEPDGLTHQIRTMIIDFTQICKTYDKKIYTKECFSATPCPKCPAIGRFKMYGSYLRYIVYFAEGKLVHEQIELKRIMCKSCKSTHAVMPGDLIPYKLLSLFVVMLLLVACIVDETPVLRVAQKYELSFQIINIYLAAFSLFANRIHQYFKERLPTHTPPATDRKSVVALIKKPYTIFQCGYVKLNRRPCFMCKFLDGAGAPPIGIHAPRGAAT